MDIAAKVIVAQMLRGVEECGEVGVLRSTIMQSAMLAGMALRQAVRAVEAKESQIDDNGLEDFFGAAYVHGFLAGMTLAHVGAIAPDTPMGEACADVIEAASKIVARRSREQSGERNDDGDDDGPDCCAN